MLSENDHCLFFWDDKLLTQQKDLNCVIPLGEVKHDTCLGITQENYYFLGNFENKTIYVVNLHSSIKINTHHLFLPARDLLTTVEGERSKLILRAKQLINWHRSSLYCGSCGSPTTISSIEIAKICTHCQKIIYPASFPAVIVLIEHGDKILLARSPHFPKGVYSTLAGFVEAGESCEEAVKREVLEEVGIIVKDLKYFGSQSWPFPNSFMVGFKAHYESGQMCINDKELEDAQWFSREALPNLPPPASIARHMIDSFLVKNNLNSAQN
ncbi:MAG: NAD(+) diphosphatase [Gammaproteobacteria bacterium]|nr:NAD(+) diphosphatase [Gammaproteobacteria bacterium]